jgi:predicted DCC family thiol-disulfide oxidoreductase YuxK
MFAPLQSQAGMAALHQANIKGIPAGTVMLFYRGRYYTRSAAALHTLKLLGGLWKLLFIFMLVPPFIRNYVYDYIAARRYKWFGRTESCMIPSPELTERFIS